MVYFLCSLFFFLLVVCPYLGGNQEETPSEEEEKPTDANEVKEVNNAADDDVNKSDKSTEPPEIESKLSRLGNCVVRDLGQNHGNPHLIIGQLII